MVSSMKLGLSIGITVLLLMFISGSIYYNVKFQDSITKLDQVYQLYDGRKKNLTSERISLEGIRQNLITNLTTIANKKQEELIQQQLNEIQQATQTPIPTEQITPTPTPTPEPTTPIIVNTPVPRRTRGS
jgi:hypothetical protein